MPHSPSVRADHRAAAMCVMWAMMLAYIKPRTERRSAHFECDKCRCGETTLVKLW